MNLVIVESPAKGKTIERYLGEGYKVVASFGHVRDLPQKELGIEVKKDFKPKYVIPAKAQSTVHLLKDAMKGADIVYMATDYDREGEAIAWHIIEAVGFNKLKTENEKLKTRRITFHEITQEAIQQAIKHPREIDMRLVEAQQARRILDRLVGYKLSPFLWKKIVKGLSAGRVQSVTVRLIVDREREVKDFKAEEYWTIIAELQNQKLKIKNQKFLAILTEKDGKKIDKLAIKSEKEAKKITAELKNAQYKVKNIERKTEKRWPYPPFTTSTLQQEASKKLGFSAKKTMKLAQDLYEAGKITYMRTDSVNLSQLAINSARKLVNEEFSQKYLPQLPKIYKTRTKAAQEAHEAIRPTYITNLQTQISKLKTNQRFSQDHLKLYELIWTRMIACQMKEADLEIDVANIQANNYLLRTSGTKIKFKGFMKVWPLKIEEKTLPSLAVGEVLQLIELLKEQHFTEPPARYTEASLIKALEQHGIGRPSTYAPIISTIQERGYVIREKRYFYPQEMGFIVTDLLVKHFPEIVNISFTAGMEESLDEIAEGKLNRVKMLADFYGPFEKNLLAKEKEVKKSQPDEKTDKTCPECAKPIIIKMGRFGKFYACSGFPECKYTDNIVIKTGLKCPECQDGDIIERKTKKGKTFWGCSRYPECKYATWDNPTRTNSNDKTQHSN